MKSTKSYPIYCLLFLYLNFFTLNLSAQQTECGFSKSIISQNDYQDTNEQLRKSVQSNRPLASTRTEASIPIVVHVVWKKSIENITDEAILNQINILNLDFNGKNNDIEHVPDAFKSLIATDGIRFCLATKTPDGKPTTGIVRVNTNIDFVGAKEELYSSEAGGSTAWNTDKYLNIWVAEINDFVTGFGTFPHQAAKEKDGVVVHYKYFGQNTSEKYGLGRVCVHEIGHYLGLNHIWGNDASCVNDDGVEDTPLQSNYYSGCPSHPQSSCGSEDLFMNFMDYVDDNCMFMFTKEQMLRMKTTLELFRPGLLENESNCNQNISSAEDFLFTIYPNPAKDKLTLSFPDFSHQITKVVIYDSYGKKVYQSTQFLAQSIIIDISKFNSGIYYIKINDIVKKLLVL